MSQPSIPRSYFKFFKWFCKPELLEELQGDLEEAFFEHVEEFGVKKAQSIYKREILKMIRPRVMKHVVTIPSNMGLLTKNYLKTSIRAIKLNPFYISANIIGMAIALSIATIGFFNYRFNDTFNHQFEKAEQLYKIHPQIDGTSLMGQSAAPMAGILEANGVTAIQYTSSSIAVRTGKRLFKEPTAFADESFLEYFNVKNLENSPISSLSNEEIIINRTTARKIFNEDYPVGELVYMVFPNQKEQSFVVKDVIEDLSYNTSFFYTILLSMDNYYDIYGIAPNDWSEWLNGTFVYLENGDTERVSAMMDEYVEAQNVASPELNITGFQLDNILLWPTFENQLYRGRFRGHLHPASVIGTFSSAFAILLLACFNFINTSIALSGKRLKEIAVRKILGGNRRSTISQFMIENSFMIFLAVILSFGISYFLIPTYNAMFGMALIQIDRIPYQELVLFAIGLIALVTLLSAAYPALHISKFPPLVIFREKVILSGKNKLMPILLTFQFALCFYNMFGLFLLVDNSYYQESLDRGYGVDQIVNIPLNRVEQYSELRNQLEQTPGVLGVSGSENLIGFSLSEQALNYRENESEVEVLSVGYEYPDVCGLRLQKGSLFTSETPNTNEAIVNQMLFETLGEDALNQQVTLSDKKYTIIGVVDDFNTRPIMMDNTINPTILTQSGEETFNYISVTVEGSANEMNRVIEKVWYETFPQEVYSGFLQEEVMESMRETNDIMIKINIFLGLITILISVLGLYTLISLAIQRRSKEFGVRKVLGASSSTIVHLIGKHMYWIIGVSAIMGLIGGFIVLDSLFDVIYAYHIAAAPHHFIAAAASVLGIVALALGYKVYQTGKLNPSTQLRTE